MGEGEVEETAPQRVQGVAGYEDSICLFSKEVTKSGQVVSSSPTFDSISKRNFFAPFQNPPYIDI